MSQDGKYLFIGKRKSYSRPVLVSLVQKMITEDKQFFPLRMSILYCLQCYLYKNDYGKSMIIQTLLPQTENSS